MIRQVSLLVATRGLVLPSPSAIERYVIRSVEIDVKRDDQWRLSGSGIAGNKARKFLEFAEEDSGNETIVSMGGHQSNAMVALAALCKERNLTFLYLVKPVPRWLRNYPSGNFARGKFLGAQYVELKHYKDLYENKTKILSSLVNNWRWVPQGGACAMAERGLKVLADEIAEQCDVQGLHVVVPAGTGTTALFLARHLQPRGATVWAVPCAVGSKGLQREMRRTDDDSGGGGIFPSLLENDCEYRFGTPSKVEIDLWLELRRAGLFVDLLYAPHAWDSLLRSCAPGGPLFQQRLLYVHCGGTEGVATQLTRYRRLGLFSDDDLDDDDDDLDLLDDDLDLLIDDAVVSEEETGSSSEKT